LNSLEVKGLDKHGSMKWSMRGTRMIYEIKLDQIKKNRVKNPYALFYICCPIPKGFIKFSQYRKCLAFTPNFEHSDLNKNEFERKYRSQLKSPICRELIKHLKNLDVPIYVVTKDGDGLLWKILHSL
jgi:hypothetical protein